VKINLKRVVALSLAVLLTACSPSIKQDNKDTGGQEKANTSKTKGQIIPVKADKAFLIENGIQIIDRRLSGKKYELHYPEIQGLIDEKTQDRINNDIKDSITALSKEIWAGKEADREKDQNEPVIRHAGHIVYGNYNNVLSIREGFFSPATTFMRNGLKHLHMTLIPATGLGLRICS